MSADDWPEDDECTICGIELTGAGSHYHCGNCGAQSSMQGHYGLRDGVWGFKCEAKTVAEQERAS